MQKHLTPKKTIVIALIILGPVTYKLYRDMFLSGTRDGKATREASVKK